MVPTALRYKFGSDNPNDNTRGRNSSVGNMLGSLACVMQRPGFHPARSRPVESTFLLEMTWVLTPFPTTLSDKNIHPGPVCAHMHSIARTQKFLTFMS